MGTTVERIYSLDQVNSSGFLERFVAFFIDAKICFLSTALFAMGLVACGLPEAAAGALFPILFLVYYTLLNSDSRQTPGKWIVGIRVMAADGAPLSKKAALKRAGGYILSGIPFGLGFFWALGGEKRTWHDRLAGSRVSEARPRGTVARVVIAIAAFLIVAYNLSGAAGYFYNRGLQRAEKMTHPATP